MVRRGRVRKAGKKSRGILQEAMGNYKMDIPKSDFPKWGDAFPKQKPIIDDFPSMKDKEKY